MLEVRFFASVRERLGAERIVCPMATTPNALIASLSRLHGPLWEEVLRARNIIVAVNHQVVGLNHPLCDGDEIAFFPPITGG